MHECPIMMQPYNVRSILEGKKTQTRRAVKHPYADQELGHVMKRDGLQALVAGGEIVVCPYGGVGDRLWVKETYWHNKEANLYAYRADGEMPAMHRAAGDRWQSPRYMSRKASRITLELTEVRVQRLQDISEADAIAEGATSWCTSGGLYWSSGADALDDNRNPSFDAAKSITGPRADYGAMWEKINGLGSWNLNPWVWALTFKKLEAGQ